MDQHNSGAEDSPWGGVSPKQYKMKIKKKALFLFLQRHVSLYLGYPFQASISGSSSFQQRLLAFPLRLFGLLMWTHTGHFAELWPSSGAIGSPVHRQAFYTLPRSTLWPATVSQSRKFLYICISCVKYFSSEHWLILIRILYICWYYIWFQ